MDIYLKKRDLLFNGDVVGIRLEVWLGLPMRSDRVVSCEMQSQSLASEIIEDTSKVIRCLKGNPIKMRIEGNLLVSDDERDTVEICSIAEFKKQYMKAESILRKAEEGYSKVPEYARILKKKLIEEGVVVYTDDVSVDMSGLSIRFIGGTRAWSGDEDVCDATVLNPSIGRKIQSIVRKYEKECGMKIYFSTGEKAWSYFEFTPKFM